MEAAPGRARQLGGRVRARRRPTRSCSCTPTRRSRRAGPTPCARPSPTRPWWAAPSRFRFAGAGPRAPARRVGRARAARARAACPTATRRCSRGAARSTRSAACPRRRSWRTSTSCARCAAAAGSRCSPLPAATSARRYLERGVLRTVAKNTLALLGLRARPRPRPARRLVPADDAAAAPAPASADAIAASRRDVPAALALHAPPQARLRRRHRDDARLHRLFVLFPMPSGWCVAGGDGRASGGGDRAAAARGCSRSVVARSGGALLLARRRSSTPRARSSTSCATTSSRTSSACRSPSSSRWRTGDLMSRCVNDLTAVRLLLGPGLLSVIQTPILFVAIFGAMFAIDARLALLRAAPVPALHPDRARLRPRDARQQPRGAGRASPTCRASSRRPSPASRW